MYSIEFPGERRAYVLFKKQIKKVLKETARHILYWNYKKSYKYYVNKDVAELSPILRDRSNEFFFGYYDKSPERNGKVLFHEMESNHINIVVKSIADGKEEVIGTSIAFNWQMGARALWLTEDIVSYNDFDGQKYVSKWYSLSEKSIVRTVPLPTMDFREGKYILSPNFQKLRIIDPCYAYNNLPIPTDEEFLDNSKDGIWIYDLVEDKLKLLISTLDIINCKNMTSHHGGYHGLNHIMISPNGESFIFIHRCRCGCERYDRLMFYEFKNKKLSCLMDGKLQSHFCWINNQTVFGYGENDNRVGFYKIDINTKQPVYCELLTKEHPKDGHPTVYKDWIVIDSYPGLNRMQSLLAYNYKNNKIVFLGEFFHDMKHSVFTRCDLHPRFDENGNRLYFDTLFMGTRQLNSLKLTKLFS